MKKIILKILNQIAKKNNTDISEFFAVFMGNIAVNGNIDDILKNYDLDDKEKEILKEFFEYLKSDVLNEKDEFIENFIKTLNLNKAFKNLALFFAIFIPEDILLSKDPNRIKEALKIYPDEIQEAIIKSLEMLSLANTNIDTDLKLNILREVLNTIIILTFIIRNLNA